MSELLDQSEIDALLAGATAAVETPAPSAPAAPIAPRFALESVLYDFKRPKRVTNDQIRALSSIHEVFSRNLGVTLSGYLRSIIDVQVVGVEQLTYSEFIHSLPNPTCFMTLEAPPLEGKMCLELSPLIVYPMIDRLLGGSAQNVVIPQRPLTSIEWRLMGWITDQALHHLSEVWRNLVDAEFAVSENESNPQLVHIVAPNEVVVYITFELRFRNHAGTMSLCIPFNTIETVLAHLNTHSWFYKPRSPSEAQQRHLMRSVTRARVDLTAWLGQTTISLGELRSLRPGDIIDLNKPHTTPLLLQVAGKNKFAGEPGQHRGRRALRLTRSAAIDEPI